MRSPIVSVVVNNYNNEKYLKECLDSLIDQTYKNIEIVVVDALSTDGSRKIIDSYALKYSQIRVIYSDIYIKYPAISYNLGFLNCTGDYIAVNDPDDISMPTRIEKQLEYLVSNPDVDVVGSNVVEFNDTMEHIMPTTVEKNVCLARPPARNPTLMFRKSVMAAHGLWRWECEYAADFEWLYRWYSAGVKFYILEDALVKYRYAHGSNLSITYSVNQTFKLATFRTYFGLKMFKSSGLKWWIVTLETYYYLCSILFKRCLKKVLNSSNK